MYFLFFTIDVSIILIYESTEKKKTKQNQIHELEPKVWIILDLYALLKLPICFVYKSFIKNTDEVSCVLVGENKLIFTTPK